jgi:Cache domain
MALDRLEVKVSIQKLLLGLTLVIVPLSVLGLYLTERSDKALDQATGQQFKTMADMYSREVSAFFADRVQDAKLLATDTTVVDAVESAGKSYQSLNDDAANKRIDGLKQKWNTPGGAALMKGVLDSKASEFLRRRREELPRLIHVTVTDDHGAVVAATSRPMAYSQTDNEDWHAVYAEGKGAVNVGKILFDDAAKVYYVDVGVPILEPGSNRWIGVLSAAVNINDVLSRFEQPVGAGARALLVSDDGTVISGPGVDYARQLKSDAYTIVSESLGTVQGRQTGYLRAQLPPAPRIIGFSDVAVGTQYKNLNWIVLVGQDERQALGPVRSMGLFAIFMVVLALVMLTLLTVYYSLHRKQRFEDIEEALPSHGHTASA